MTVREQRITIEKSARYYCIGEPGPHCREIWISCHGYGQLAARFIRHFEVIASTTRLIVAPEALHRFYLDPTDRPASDRRVGATWMTREDRESDINDYVRYLDRVCDELWATTQQPVKLIGLGFSQGAATITRWAVTTHHPVTSLILWGSGLPPDLDWASARDRLRQMRVLLVGGEQDAQMSPRHWDEQQVQLTNHQVAFERFRFAGGHHIDPSVLKRLVQD